MSPYDIVYNPNPMSTQLPPDLVGRMRARARLLDARIGDVQREILQLALESKEKNNCVINVPLRSVGRIPRLVQDIIPVDSVTRDAIEALADANCVPPSHMLKCLMMLGDRLLAESDKGYDVPMNAKNKPADVCQSITAVAAAVCQELAQAKPAFERELTPRDYVEAVTSLHVKPGDTFGINIELSYDQVVALGKFKKSSGERVTKRAAMFLFNKVLTSL